MTLIRVVVVSCLNNDKAANIYFEENFVLSKTHDPLIMKKNLSDESFWNFMNVERKN